MNQVIYTQRFAKDIKPFIKRHPTFRQTLEKLEAELIKEPRLGTPYGGKIYKIRVSDESKGKGKSGGFRIITYVVDERMEGTDVYLVTIFDKPEEASIKKSDVEKLLKALGLD